MTFWSAATCRRFFLRRLVAASQRIKTAPIMFRPLVPLKSSDKSPHSQLHSVAKLIALSHNHFDKMNLIAPEVQRESAMQKKLLMAIVTSSAICVGTSVAQSLESPKDKPAGSVKLPDNWSSHVTVKDLTDEIGESSTRMSQNLKKASDFDKFLKNINTEGHLAAVLTALVQEHPESGKWKGIAADIQEQALIVAKAAEAKGGKNFRDAQAAHKKIADLVKKGDGGDRTGAAGASDGSPDWPSLGALGDVMKRVEPSYKYIRGKMSNEAAFKKDSETIRHNAAMLYIFGQISPAFRPAEADMPKLSGTMSSAAADLLEAVNAADFAKASEANTAINTSCNECHKIKRFVKKGSDLDF